MWISPEQKTKLLLDGVLDSYGYLRHGPAGWDWLAERIRERENLVISYAPDRNTGLDLVIMCNFENPFDAIWGGRCTSHVFVGVNAIGAFHFDMTSDRDFQPGYISEKIGLDGSDGVALAELLSEVRKRIANSTQKNPS